MTDRSQGADHPGARAPARLATPQRPGDPQGAGDTIMCQHADTTLSADYGYTAPVARPPYTEENPAAHGGITYTETCARCGAQRAVNSNGGHTELGPWGPDLATRARRTQMRRLARRQQQEREDAEAVRRAGFQLLHATWRDATVSTRQGRRVIRISDIEHAADQEDTGDGLVPVYRGLLRHIRDRLASLEEA